MAQMVLNSHGKNVGDDHFSRGALLDMDKLDPIDAKVSPEFIGRDTCIQQ